MRFLDYYGLQRLWNNRIKAVFQPKITATGILKGNGSGSVTAASGTDLPSHNHNASNINAGTLTVNRGGTGANTFTSGALLKGNGTGAIANGPTIDDNETTKFLRHDGSWQVPAGTYSHPTKTAAAAAAKKVGNDSLGHVVLGAALTAADVGAAASSHTHGGITNDGKAGGSKVAGTGDWLMIASGSDGAIVKSDLQFSDSTTRFLRQNGSWGIPVTGVKGNSQSSYQTGNVNLTAANIGAAASNHSHAFSAITGKIDNSQLPGWLKPTYGIQGSVEIEDGEMLTIEWSTGLVMIDQTGIALETRTGGVIGSISWERLVNL